MLILSTPSRRALLGVLLLTCLWVPKLEAQEDLWSRGSVGTGLLLRKLDGVKRVLMIGAHPDDEDTALLAALSRGLGVETAYLSLSRGEGGQNLLGPEMDEGLGLLRTGELMAARGLDGGRQYFSRAFDFGFSKSAEETFRYWPKEDLLEDLTWVVRTFRPQVIVSVFSGTPRDGHGQHQAAGIVAHEVFDAAGDPTRFPEQMARGVSPWTPTKLYLLTRRNPVEGTTTIETGAFDPLLGRSHYQIAMDSRSQHRSQDMGVAQPMGPRVSTLALVQTRTPLEGPDELFAGVDTTVLSLAGDLPQTEREVVEGHLKEYRMAIADAWEALDVTEPWQATPALGRAVEVLQGMEGDEMGQALQERRSLVQEAYLRSAGVVVDVRMEDDLLVPGEDAVAVLEVWNGGPFELSGATGQLLVPEGWMVEGIAAGGGGSGRGFGSGAALGLGQEPGTIPPGTLARWRYRVSLPSDADLSRLYYMENPRDGEMYDWPADPDLWGQPGNLHPLLGSFHLRVDGAGAVGIQKAAAFRGVDKATGEFVEPVHVVPALSVELDPGVLAWPVGATDPREFTVTVRSQSDRARSGQVSIQTPPGWRTEPESLPFSLSSAGEQASFFFSVTAPRELAQGTFLLEALVRSEEDEEFREGVTLVDYPHVLRGALFKGASASVSAFPVEVEENIRVGYVMGSGDSGPEAIRQMGLQVELLQPDVVRAGSFGDFDVVVLGIRAYETRPDLAAANDRLLDFARGGGTVIVQYNKYEFPQGGYAPYPVTMSRPHDRVSDETVPVRILDPEHPVFSVPNRIEASDFEGWAQERGLYFLGQWDDRYVPLLEMADPGEDPKRGGLLVAPLGGGVYVYTGLAFFRQFPEGVPGAYRLFANLLSLKGAGGGGNESVRSGSWAPGSEGK